MPPVIAGLFVAVVRIPLAYLLAVRLGRGGLGVPWAVNLTLAIQVCALLVWFLARFWRRPSTEPPGPSKRPSKASAILLEVRL